MTAYDEDEWQGIPDLDNDDMTGSDHGSDRGSDDESASDSSVSNTHGRRQDRTARRGKASLGKAIAAITELAQAVLVKEP